MILIEVRLDINLVSLKEFVRREFSFVGGAIACKTELLGAVRYGKALPGAHSVDDVHIAMNTRIDALLPLAVNLTVIAA